MTAAAPELCGEVGETCWLGDTLLPLQKQAGEGTVHGPGTCKCLFQIPAVYQVIKASETNGSKRQVIALQNDPVGMRVSRSSRVRLSLLT